MSKFIEIEDIYSRKQNINLSQVRQIIKDTEDGTAIIIFNSQDEERIFTTIGYEQLIDMLEENK